MKLKRKTPKPSNPNQWKERDFKKSGPSGPKSYNPGIVMNYINKGLLDRFGRK